jgi:preprotein translocase SecF subunit
VALTVGVTASLFTSIYITHWVYDWVLERRPNTKTLSVGIHTFMKNTKFDFMKYKGLALGISWSIIVICLLVAQPWKGVQGSRIKMGMQFVGGLDMVVRYKGDVTAESIRSELGRSGYSDASVVNYKGAELYRDYSVKVPARKGQDAKDAVELKELVTAALRKVDPESLKDPRPDLNSVETKELLDNLIKNNPLGIKGEEEQIQQTYTRHIASLSEAKQRGQGFIASMEDIQNLPQEIKTFVEDNYRLGNLSVQSIQSFSPSVAGEWTKKTLAAVLWAMGAILLYIMFRFTFSFSLSAILGLIHVMLLGVGLFTLFGFEYSVAVVASFLILLGYSTSDTIVVFDRIRENMRKQEYRRVPITKLINDSINQTLSRTVLTSVSTLFVALCLFLFGGPALHDLSFPIVLGVCIGTLSTIFIAAPFLVIMDKWLGGKDKIKQHA